LISGGNHDRDQALLVGDGMLDFLTAHLRILRNENLGHRLLSSQDLPDAVDGILAGIFRLYPTFAQ
jgi:hypothetical protein